MDALRALSWMSPALGLALAVALVAALVYALVAPRPLWTVPFYWCLALAGVAAGQGLAGRGLEWLPVGNLSLGTALVACIVLFVAVHAITLWYTWGHRAWTRAQVSSPRRRG